METNSEDYLRTSKTLTPSALSDECKSEIDEEDEILAQAFEGSL